MEWQLEKRLKTYVFERTSDCMRKILPVVLLGVVREVYRYGLVLFNVKIREEFKIFLDSLKV